MLRGKKKDDCQVKRNHLLETDFELLFLAIYSMVVEIFQDIKQTETSDFQSCSGHLLMRLPCCTLSTVVQDISFIIFH